MAVEKSQISISDYLSLEKIEEKGRGFAASEPLKGGQIILQESPILVFSAFPLRCQKLQEVASSNTTAYCSHCYRCMVSEGLTCPTCCDSTPNDIIFCNSKCQSLALTTTHTPWVCDALGRLRHCSLLLEHQPEERQVQARYLVAAYNLAMISPRAFESLLSLHGDGKKIDIEIATFLHSIITTLSFPEGFAPLTIEMTASLLDKESCNSFSLMEPYSQGGGRSTRAYGLYKNASFFNHDCLPNACRFDYLDSSPNNDKNTDIIIRLIHDVPQGKEICLSYFRVGLSYGERKKRLIDYFGFECFCDRCKVESSRQDEGDDSRCAYFFAKFVCERKDCGGTLAPLLPSNGNQFNVMECNFCGMSKNNI
ncbi:hypothetical protein BVRB_1g018190 [Beta vulgaris subsp. vulgaris]|uniref:histone-lysine N-methyltransferase ASHR2 n=1 Tax=Beta vulgaris subsp. vulgaris TaxID=3555 RepID=UPI00053F9238|nr:histone-lysine N-methyltransferase ASHR2 [Beta vulgaris subsp. vulgaris]KMS99978.1 hypothetical protein BVRB_1g018190 [Beta vulgaris subsp. vulgaris]